MTNHKKVTKKHKAQLKHYFKTLTPSQILKYENNVEKTEQEQIVQYFKKMNDPTNIGAKKKAISERTDLFAQFVNEDAALDEARTKNKQTDNSKIFIVPREWWKKDVSTKSDRPSKDNGNALTKN